MAADCDTLIIGCGLAGACAALYLSEHERVLIVEAHRPGAGASGVAAGLVNPLMALRARPVWRCEEALEAFHETLERSDSGALFRGQGVLRPAKHEPQAAFFRQSAGTYPHHADWLSPGDAADRFPGVAAPHGALLVRSGGALSPASWIDRLLQTAARNGAQVRIGLQAVGWGEADQLAYADFVSTHGDVRTPLNRPQQRLYARRIILAIGGAFRHHPDLAVLNLHAVKGQTVHIRRPSFLPPRHPHLSGNGYVVVAPEGLHLGSTYEHQFNDLNPSRDQTVRILRRTAQMVPGLQHETVYHERAGLRVTVPGTRLPVFDRLPGRARTWLFTGLSSKGLLMAPLVARRIPAYLQAPPTLPTELRLLPTGNGS